MSEESKKLLGPYMCYKHNLTYYFTLDISFNEFMSILINFPEELQNENLTKPIRYELLKQLRKRLHEKE